MIKNILSILMLLISMNTIAQSTNVSLKKNNSYSKPSRDYVMLQFGYENWLGVDDSIKITGIGRAFNAYICYDFPLSKSNFSFAAGAGVGASNIYFSNQSINLTDTFTSISFIPEIYEYKKYKLTTCYLEAPFELRYFTNKENRNKGFKAAVGLKVGTLLTSHTKGKREVNDKPITDKVITKRYLESVKYAATLRLGYGNFSVYGQYSIGNLFKVNSGPENIRPYQLGICISGL